MNIIMVIVHFFALVIFFPLLIITVPMHLMLCMSSGYARKKAEKKEMRMRAREYNDSKFDGRLGIVMALILVVFLACMGGAIA